MLGMCGVVVFDVYQYVVVGGGEIFRYGYLGVDQVWFVGGLVDVWLEQVVVFVFNCVGYLGFIVWCGVLYEVVVLWCVFCYVWCVVVVDVYVYCFVFGQCMWQCDVQLVGWVVLVVGCYWLVVQCD